MNPQCESKKFNLVHVSELELDLGPTYSLWKYNGEHRSLEYEGYGINLNSFESGHQISEMIVYISEKDWATAEVIGDLVLALNYHLQGLINYRGFGVEWFINETHKGYSK